TLTGDTIEVLCCLPRRGSQPRISPRAGGIGEQHRSLYGLKGGDEPGAVGLLSFELLFHARYFVAVGFERCVRRLQLRREIADDEVMNCLRLFLRGLGAL